VVDWGIVCLLAAYCGPELNWVWLRAWSGGLLDPGQGSWRSPCLWMVPPLMWTCLVAKHTLQVPLDLLICCDKGQFWDIVYRFAKHAWLASGQRTCHACLQTEGAKYRNAHLVKTISNKAQNNEKKIVTRINKRIYTICESRSSCRNQKKRDLYDKIKANPQIWLEKINESTARTRSYPHYYYYYYYYYYL